MTLWVSRDDITYRQKINKRPYTGKGRTPSGISRSMKKFTRDSDPTAALFQDETESEEEPRPRRSTGSQRDRNQSRRGRSHKPRAVLQDQPRSKSTQRPDEVSERVWGLAEQWMEAGEAHFGRRPPVNQAGFSKRLKAKINSDPQLLPWLKKGPGYWERFETWDDGFEFVNDVVARAIEMFYEYLTEDQKNSAALQFAFLNDEWDEWIYQAIDSVKIRWIKTNVSDDHWKPMTLPTAVFDPATVGVPDPDDVHPDPFWEGRTFREVEEINDRDLAELQPMDDEAYERMHEDYRKRQAEALARFASHTTAIVAKRTTTTKEH